MLGASVGAKWQFGSLEQDRKLNDFLGTALVLNLDLGYGLTRNIVLGVWGGFDNHGAPSDCRLCSGGKSFAGGPFIRYHLVQGTRFDPWGSFALGVRSTTVDTDVGSKDYFGRRYHEAQPGRGLVPDVQLRFRPVRHVRLGHLRQLGRPHRLGTGLRLVVDLPGK